MAHQVLQTHREMSVGHYGAVAVPVGRGQRMTNQNQGGAEGSATGFSPFMLELTTKTLHRGINVPDWVPFANVMGPGLTFTT